MYFKIRLNTLKVIAGEKLFDDLFFMMAYIVIVAD